MGEGLSQGRGLLKCVASIVLLAIAIVKIGASFDHWIIITLAGLSGGIWESAYGDFFHRKPSNHD